MPHFSQRHRAFGVLLLLLLKAFKRARNRPRRHNPKLILLVLSLIFIFVVLPTGATVVVRIVQARWEANHPPQTLVPDLAGRDPISAEASVRGAQLRPQISYTTIDDKCWQDQPAPNTVVDQEPEAFTPVIVGTQVQFTIAIQNSK